MPISTAAYGDGDFVLDVCREVTSIGKLKEPDSHKEIVLELGPLLWVVADLLLYERDASWWRPGHWRDMPCFCCHLCVGQTRCLEGWGRRCIDA